MESLLPKGFYFLANDELKLNRNILSSFINGSNNLFSEVVEFPPVAFADTFRKGANITGDKTFVFKDRSNRELILTPDSQAHLFNYYLSSNNQNKNIKYSWVSPIFRYRNIPKRHYYQIGYASINHSKENEIVDLFLCVRQLIHFVKKLTPQKVTITVYNSALVYEIILSILSVEEDANIFFDKIRNCEALEVSTLIVKSFAGSNYKTILLELFSGKFNGVDELLSSLSMFKEGSKVLEFIRLIRCINEIEIKVELSNLYCSEILDGIGFTLTIDDIKIGDGGIYNIYGRRYNPQINTAISVCVGSGLYRKIEYVPSKNHIVIFVKYYQADTESILFISDELSKLGYLTNVQPWTKHNKKYFNESYFAIFIDKITETLFSGKLIRERENYLEVFNNLSAAQIISIFNKKIASTT